VNLDSKILELLRNDAQSAELLAQTLSHEGEQVVDADAVRSSLAELASRGLVRASPGGSSRVEANGDGEPAAKADRWEITEEGLAVAEPRSSRVAQAPYDRAIGGEEGGRDAGFWVLVVIGVVTAVCAAYTLLTASGVLGGG
jgi:hypothetical protein